VVMRVCHCLGHRYLTKLKLGTLVYVMTERVQRHLTETSTSTVIALSFSLLGFIPFLRSKQHPF
jgi:hypothetical protein